VASAHSDSIPLLAITAQVSTQVFGKGGAQDSSSGNWNVDVVEVYRAATKLSLMLQSGQQMPGMIRRMIRTAVTGRTGAVHLNLPADVAKQPAPVDGQPVTSYYAHTAAAGDPAAIQQAAKCIHAARKPAFLVGHGIHLSGAWHVLQRVAEAEGMPVATTLKGKSAFPEHHALSLGVFGFGGHPLSEAYLFSDVDVLVIIGTSLGEFQSNGWDPRLVSNRTVIQIDLDPLEIGKNYPVDLSIVGDAKSVLEALASALADLPPGMRQQRYEALENLSTGEPRYATAEALQGQAAVLKPQAVVAKMSELLPLETLLFVDVGNCLCWAGQFYEARQPGTVFCATNVASMGYAIAASIGGKIAAPTRPVVALLGDGAFGMNGLEMHTAADYGLPVIWVALNNGGHGMVYHGEKALSGKSYLSLYRAPLDISAIAGSLGIQTFKVRTLEEFAASLRQALELQAPCVIDALVDLEEIPRSLQKRVNTLGAFFGQEKRQNR
jgi:acetolactate synthase-1/2/3 large subunit